MFFNTIEEYNEELNNIRSRMSSMEKRMEKYPERTWIGGNYRGFKELHEIILKDRDNFLEMMDENINLHICGEMVKNHKISLSVITELFDNFHDLTTFLSDFLKSNFKYTFESHDLKLERVSEGSIQILFSMDENITDLNEVYLNHQVFNKLLDLIDSDIQDLEKQKEIIGLDSILSYKKFLKIIIENKLDFTLESNSRKVGLTHSEALKIYNAIDNCS